MNKLTSVANIKDPYSKRILSNILHKDSFKIYSNTPGRLARLTRGLSGKQLATPLAKGKWSIAQIVAHLYDSEVVMGWRYRMAIAQSGSKIQPYDQNLWAKHLHYEAADCRKKIELLIRMRRDHIELLRSLPKKSWKRYGMHEERGKETIERMVHMIAGHDINHLRQIENIRRSVLKPK